MLAENNKHVHKKEIVRSSPQRQAESPGREMR